MWQHRLAAGIAIGSLLLTGVFHFMLCRPLARNLRAERDNQTQKERGLLRRGWPVAPDRIEELIRTKEAEQQTLTRRRTEVTARTCQGFDERIRSHYGTPRQFQAQVSRLDYQEELNRVMRKFQELGVTLAPDVLGLGEASSWPHTYQLVLQLWTVESVLDLSLAHGLRPTVAAPEQAAAAVRVLAPRAYVTAGSDRDPYLLEIPVAVSLTGNVADLTAMLHACSQGKVFIAVPHAEIHKTPPDAAGPAAEMRTAMECSMFFPLRD
jgi:hypothetical protein